MADQQKHVPQDMNRLLAALPGPELERILPHLEILTLHVGEVLDDSGNALNYVYFPTTAIVSLLYTMDSGVSAEIAVVGNEGVVGIALFMGGGAMPNKAVVQSEGHAFRMEGRLFKEEFKRAGKLQHLLLRYTQALLTQMTQTAVCNRHHSVDQQLCRWLLLSLDRMPSNGSTLSQELLSVMVGTEHDGMSEAVSKLEGAGLIRSKGDRISVLDRPGLEARVCECYAVVKKESSRLLPELSAG